MKSLILITVGKLKDDTHIQIENDYLKRITSPALQIHEVKASGESPIQEALNLEKKISELEKKIKLYKIAMTEHGEIFNTPAFANKVQNWLEQTTIPCFIMAGALGFEPTFLKTVHEKLSLSPLTFPHQMARLILVEQLYRAQTIRTGHPYHH